jgi:hypothetical protein
MDDAGNPINLDRYDRPDDGQDDGSDSGNDEKYVGDEYVVHGGSISQENETEEVSLGTETASCFP